MSETSIITKAKLDFNAFNIEVGFNSQTLLYTAKCKKIPGMESSHRALFGAVTNLLYNIIEDVLSDVGAKKCIPDILSIPILIEEPREKVFTEIKDDDGED